MEAVTNHDVLLGRSDCSTKHIGTIAFRAFVASRLGLYRQAGSRKSFKTHQIVSVVNSVHEAGGRFMVDVGFGLWWSEVDRKYAREKVCNTFRDAIKQLNNDKQRVWGESACFAETETFASIVAFLVAKEMKVEESGSVLFEENTGEPMRNLEQLSLVEKTTQNVGQAHEGISLVEVLNNLLENSNNDDEPDVEHIQFQSLMKARTLEEMKDLRIAEDGRDIE